MNITINLPVKDEQQKKELEKYLIEKAKEFLRKKNNYFEWIDDVDSIEFWDDEEIENIWKIAYKEDFIS